MNYNIDDEELRAGAKELFEDPVLEAHQLDCKRKYLESLRVSIATVEEIKEHQRRTEQSFKEFDLYIGYRNLVIENVYSLLKLECYDEIIGFNDKCQAEFNRMREYNNNYYKMLLDIMEGRDFVRENIDDYGNEYQRAAAELELYVSASVNRFETLSAKNIVHREVFFECHRSSKQLRTFASVFVREYHIAAGRVFNYFKNLESEKAIPQEAPQTPTNNSEDIYTSLFNRRRFEKNKKIDFNEL
jgi:CRISPR/Cas system-associated protein endoribonuclease Cas2